MAGIQADLASQMARFADMQAELPGMRARLEGLDGDLRNLGPRPSGEARVRLMDLTEERRALARQIADVESRRAEGEFLVRAAAFLDVVGGPPPPQAPLRGENGNVRFVREEEVPPPPTPLEGLKREREGDGSILLEEQPAPKRSAGPPDSLEEPRGMPLEHPPTEIGGTAPDPDPGRGPGGTARFPLEGPLGPFVRLRKVCDAGTQWEAYNLRVNGRTVRATTKPRVGEKRKRSRAAKQAAGAVVDSRCPACKAGDLVPSGGDLLCTSCGASHINYVVDDKYFRGQCVVTNTGSRFSYKKPNHFRDWMLRIQAKETKKIPPTLIDRVTKEMYAFNVTEARQVTRRIVLRILKRLKLTKWNDHATKITFLINGIRPKQFTDAQQDILVSAFNDVLPAWHKHVDRRRRSNFCSYGYTLHKLCQIQGWTEFLEFFPLLRGRGKLAQTDQLWAKMMAEVGWTFYPSL